MWFSDMRSDGFSLDDKRNPTGHSDIPDIVIRFKNLTRKRNHARTEQSFLVSKIEIINNGYDLSINKYKKTEYAEELERMLDG